MKHIWHAHRIAAVSVVAVLALFVILETLSVSGSFGPGTTTDPNCLPTDPGCTVDVGPSIGGTVTDGTAGSVLFVDGSGDLGEDNSNFFYDTTSLPNGGLRLGTTTRAANERLTVYTLNNSYGFIHTDGTTSVGSWAGNGFGEPGGWYGTQSDDPLYLFTNDGNPQFVLGTNGNLGVGGNTGSPAERLTITGNGTFTGDGTFGGTLGVTGLINTDDLYQIGSSPVLAKNGANISVGSNAANTNIGGYNTFVGDTAGINNVSGMESVYLGQSSGFTNTGGSSNTYLGFQAGKSATGSGNIFIGHNTVTTGTGGDDNVFVGNDTGDLNTGNRNVFVGAAAGNAHTSAQGNVFIGFFAGGSNTDAEGNVAIGYNAGSSMTGSGSNTFVGYMAGTITTAGLNTFVGRAAGFSNTTGTQNAFFGDEAGQNADGSNNTYLGFHAGYNTTGGSGNVFIGNKAGELVNDSNKLYIDNDNNATPLIFGDFSSRNVGIGTTTANSRLTVTGGSIYVSDVGKGVIVKSPDGLTCKEIGIDNAGAIVANAIACP